MSVEPRVEKYGSLLNPDPGRTASRIHADHRHRQARAEAALPGGAALPALRVPGDRGQHPLPRRPARHHFNPRVLGLLAARGPPGRVLRPRGPETGHPRQRRLPRARSRSAPEAFPGGREPAGPQAARGADSSGAGYQLRDMVLRDPAVIGRTVQVPVPVNDEIDMLLKGVFRRNVPEAERRVSDRQIGWLDAFGLRGAHRTALQRRFSDVRGFARARAPRASRGALMGSFWVLLVTLTHPFR